LCKFYRDSILTKKMKTFFLILFFSKLVPVSAQIFDKRALDEKVKQVDSSFQFVQTMYVINGIPYNYNDTARVDSVLKASDLKYLVSIDVLTGAAKSLIHSNKDVVIVTFAHSQDLKKKEALLKKVKDSFNDQYISFSQHIRSDAKDPVLYIDNQLIHHTETKQRINGLTTSSVYYIDYNEKAVSREHYGQNGKNGLVRVWTVTR